MSIYGNNLEIINEIRVYSNNKFLIGVYGPGMTDRNFHQRPYFKVYNSSKYENANKVARIYFDSPNYVYPEHKERGKEVWYLSNSDKKLLNNILNSKDIWDSLNIALAKITNSKSVYYNKPDYNLLESR